MMYSSSLIKYRYVIFMAIAIGAVSSFVSREFIFPFLIVFAGFLTGIFLISLIQKEKEESAFLIPMFIFAFLARIIMSVLVYTFNLVSIGTGLWGDGWCYSEDGYKILQLWLGGIRDFSEIARIAAGISISGTVGNCDFWNAFVYFFTGKSPLSLIFINAAASSLTIIFVYYIAKQIYSKKAAMWASILTAFWPSLFLWSISNLKEPITILLLTVLIWATLRLKRQFRFYLVFLIAASGFALKEFRTIVIVVYVAAFFVSLLAAGYKTQKKGLLFLALLIIISGFILTEFIGFHWMDVFRSGDSLKFYNIKASSVLEFMHKARTYRAYGGSAFLVGWDFMNPFVLVFFTPLALFVAFLAPFPWQLGSAIQVMAMPEMIIYYLLVPLMISGSKFILCHRTEGIIMVAYVFIMFFALAFLEGNIGTLFRHRAIILPFCFILVAVGLDRYQLRHDLKGGV